MSLRIYSFLISAAAAVSSLAACASDATGGGPGSGPTGPRFLVAGVTIDPEGRTGYGVVVDSLDQDVDVDLTRAAIFPGQPSIAPSPARDGRVWVGLAEEPVVQRYGLGPDDTLVFQDEVSFAGRGLRSAGSGLVVVSPSRGYVFDLDTLSVVGFDPTEMILRESLPLEGVDTPPGGSNNFSFIAPDGDRIVFIVNGFREDGTAVPRSRAVFLDSRSDTLSYADIEGCGRLGWFARDGSGDLWFATHPAQGGLVAGGLAGTPPSPACLARIPTGGTTFAEGFVSFGDLVESPAGALVQGPGGSAYTLIFDDPDTEVTEDNGDQLSLTTGWSYYRLQLDDLDSDQGAADLERVPGLSPGLGIAIGFDVPEGDAVAPTPFIARIGSFFQTSTFFDLSDPDGSRERVTAPGISIGAFRLR